MTLTATRFPALTRHGALLALLAAGLLWPAGAGAGCVGGHLSSRAGASAYLSHSDLMRLAGAAPAPASGPEKETSDLTEPDDPSPPEPTAPCTGAMCSGNPALPISPVLAVEPFGGEHWAMTPSLSPEADALASLWRHDDACTCPIDRASTIFHPPRPSCLLIPTA